jgi:hypothetical protein
VPHHDLSEPFCPLPSPSFLGLRGVPERQRVHLPTRSLEGSPFTFPTQCYMVVTEGCFSSMVVHVGQATVQVTGGGEGGVDGKEDVISSHVFGVCEVEV